MKRVKKILIYLLSVIAALLLFLNLLLNFPLIQTWVTHRVASYYSAKLHAKVEIGKVEFEFLKKLVLRDVYIEDQHQDTLLYTQALKLDIGNIDFTKHNLYVSDLILDKARFNAVMYKNDSDINLQFIIDYFASKDTTPSTGPKWNMKVGALTLNDIYFSYRNEHNSYQTTAMNFSDLEIHHINGKISDIQLPGDTLRATIEHLSAQEQCGFILKDFSCYVKLSSKEMVLNALKIVTPTTHLSTDLVFKYNRFIDFYDFVNKVNMHAVFRKSTLCFDDLGKFTDALSGVHNCFTISGEYSGTVKHLRGHDINLAWGKTSSFSGNASLDGLPDIDKTYIKVDVNHLVTSKSEVELLPRPPFDKQANIELPSNLSYLKTIDFNGSFKGYIYDFDAAGTLSTAIGNVSASLSMQEDTAHNDMAYYKGSLSTKGFNLGTFWQNKDLGPITSSVTIQGKGLTRNNADAEITGSIDGFSFKKYNYTGLALSGELRKAFFSGLLEADDPNLQMDFNGDIDIASKIHTYHFNTYITKANLAKLHIVKDSIAPVVLSTHAEVELKGNTIDNMDGYIHVDSTKYTYHKNNYHLDYVKINSIHNKGGFHNITVNSDYLDATITGKFPLIHLPQCIQNMMSFYIPNVFEKEKSVLGDKEDDNYDFDITFNKNTGLTDLFVPTLKIAQGTHVKAHYREQKNIFNLSSSSPVIEWAGKKMKHLDVTADGNTSKMNFRATCDSLYMSDSLYAAAFTLNGGITNDTTHYSIKWNNDSANYANIPGFIAFPNKTDIYFKLIDPVISLRDSIWQTNKQNLVLIDTSGISASELEFYHIHQSVTIRGKLSKQKNDAMVAIFKKLNLEDFNTGNVTKVQGTIDGTVSVANVYDQHPFFAGSLAFNNLKFNRQSLGNGSVNCYWDNSVNAIALNGQLATKDTRFLSFVGNYYDRDSNNLSIDANIQNFPVKIFEPYIKDYTSDFDGSISGNAKISGNLNKPLFYGDVVANIKKFKFDYLNTYYHSPAIEIAISPDTFRIIPSPVLDENKDSAIASGMLTHKQFKNFKANFNIDATDFMCLNTTESNNSLYYGKGFASGNVKFYGPLSSLHLDAAITTEKGTMFNIPLSNASEIDLGDVIRFTLKDSAHKKQQAYKVNTGGLQMHFTVHATKDATTRLIFAEKVGDIMQGTGYGTLQMDMSNTGDFSLKGEYNVLDGTYLFTAKNAISKKFAIQNGSTINWSGDPYNADIKLNAIYSKRTTLSPLFPDDTTGVYKKLIPYNCVMELTGKLMAPGIKFNLDLPSVDENTRDIVNSYLNTPTEMDRQVLALLVLNSFLPIQERASANTVGVATGVSSREFLSDQLSNMLSGISNKFNLGINWQPGTTPNSQELQVMLSTQLFNNRVAISSDVMSNSGNPNTQTENTNNIVGEVTVEYKLSKDGKVKVKAYNKANDNTIVTLANAPYTQGVGISYQEGFNTFGELWQKIKNKFRRNTKKEQNLSDNQ